MRMSRQRHIRRKQTCFLGIQTRLDVQDNCCRALEESGKKNVIIVLSRSRRFFQVRLILRANYISKIFFVNTIELSSDQCTLTVLGPV